VTDVTDARQVVKRFTDSSARERLDPGLRVHYGALPRPTDRT